MAFAVLPRMLAGPKTPGLLGFMSYLPTYLPTNQPTYSSSFESSRFTLPTYLPTYLGLDDGLRRPTSYVGRTENPRAARLHVQASADGGAGSPTGVHHEHTSAVQGR